MIAKGELFKIIAITFLLASLPISLILVKQKENSQSNAAAADKLEVEGGNLSGNATSQNDSNASGGKYILFGGIQSSAGGIGPQPTTSTPLSQGTKFVSPAGTGTACTQISPCSLSTVVANVNPGDVVFMRGGTYPISAITRWDRNGTANNYITIESYPGETAIWDGSNQPNNSERMVRVGGNYYKFRKFEIKNMPDIGFYITGSNNILDGLNVSHNRNSGIYVIGGNNNIIQNTTANDNSDAGLTGGNYDNGGNADGIGISSGDRNKIINSLTARNSDDGTDAWTSTNTTISNSIATANGLGNGDGNGFKLGGPTPSNGTHIDHSISYQNKVTGFDANSGPNVVINYVTSWNNGAYGIFPVTSTTVVNSISINNASGNIYANGTQTNNSWQRSGTPSFISTDPTSPNFLKPTVNGGFENIGAYADVNTSSTPSTSPTPIANANIVAFPGAQGWGAVSKGGRGGTVIEVTNLNDSGTGSLRAALTATGPRTVVFRVSGTINITSLIPISNPYITVAGQTAPGGGIQIRGAGISVRTHDVIIRGLRIRSGDLSTNDATWDGIEIISNAYNVIIDHNSISWAIDENVSTWYVVNNVTYSWNISSEALYDSLHVKGPHSMGFLIGGEEGLTSKISLHHNLLAHNNQRNYLIQYNPYTEIINNIVYNWGQIGMEFQTDSNGPLINIISNYYKPGSNSQVQKAVVAVPSGLAQSIYVNGNISPARSSLNQPEWNFMNGSLASLQKSTPWLMSPNPVSTKPYPDFTNDVYACVGANSPRDSVDTRIINDAKNGTGSIIDSPSEVGGWPTLATGSAPTDSDHDGIPDSWETSKGLNPNNANDRNNIAPSGYTWVEEYINSLFPSSCI